MARLESRMWEGSHDPHLPRRHRGGCAYEVYIPDSLTGRDFTFLGPVAADLTEAESSIRLLSEKATALQDTEALARLLLRAESVASSRIEGLEVGGGRLLRAEVATLDGEPVQDVTAMEVLGNVDAMRFAVSDLAERAELDLAGVVDIHRRLLAGTRHEGLGGVIRTEQNWIGGSDFNPCSASFVPPPPDLVNELLVDLVDFANDDSLPAVAQAAIAHVQFETIHPFADGNGRTGRALIHVILRRRGVAPRILPPISLVLATWSRDYVSALMGARYVGNPDSPEAVEGINAWVELFAAAASRAVADAEDFEDRIAEIQQGWRDRLGKVRRDSAASLLIGALPGTPVVTAKSAAELIARSEPQTYEGIQRLVDAGILQQSTKGRRNRAFEAREVIDAFTGLERQLASPEGNTRSSPPARTVPYRPPSGR